MTELQRRIGYSFHNEDLLQTALTHSSWSNEHGCGHEGCYERLEFLGDAVLGMISARYLYSCSPPLPEGQMTRVRAELVCEENLYRVAQELDLGKWMRLGKGEEQSGGRERTSILADMVEALIAALYLDGGIGPAEALIRTRILSDAERVIHGHRVDSKTALQELVQQTPGSCIVYEPVAETGPDHNKRFTCVVRVNGRICGTGSGRSRKEAE